MVGDNLASDRTKRSVIDDWQYRLLVESIKDYGIYMLDKGGLVVSWNAGAERFKGYAADEILGRHFSVFYTPEDQLAGEPLRALATASHGRFESEGWRVRKGGERFWASVLIEPIHDRGQLVGFAKVTRDISDRKEVERALVQVNSALQQSQKMDAVGQLTGGIAHDFSNILAVVLGSLELLRKRLPDEPLTERLLENAVQGARRGSALTRRLLAFARPQEAAPEHVHLPSLVRGMINLLQSALGPSATLDIQLPGRHNPVFADPNQLEMAVLNLAVNARDAMPEGGVITIAVREERLAYGQLPGLPAGEYACLSVQDVGTGMDRETLLRATEAFYTTKPVGRGSGLGLSMVQGTVAQAGGQFILSSELGKGTRAEIWLPLADTVGRAPVSEPEVRVPLIERRRPVVLAVDDDPLMLLNIVLMLEDLGYKVLQSNSGKHALQVLAEDPTIDLVLTDIGMPHMSGRELFERAHALYPALKFLFSTGYAQASDGEAGAPPSLSKPYTQGDLGKAIEQAVG